MPAQATIPEYSVEPNKKVLIYQGQLKLYTNKREVILEEGQIYLSWFPRSCIKFSGNFKSIHIWEPQEKPLCLECLDTNHHSVLRSDVNDDLGFRHQNGICFLEASLKGNSPQQEISCISKVKFHLINFTRYQGDECIRYEESGYIHTYGGRINLHYKNWKISIDLLKLNKVEIPELLRQSGGYGITHTGIIERLDNKDFSYFEAESIISSLYYFLSFLNGSWTSPSLPIFYDKKTNEISRSLTLFNTSPFTHQNNWFPRQNLAGISGLFAEFQTLWDDPDWKESLQVLISLYIESNNPRFFEQSILLTQSAFELIAWLIFVQKEKIITSNKQWKKKSNNTKELLRDIFAYFEIPTTVPPSIDGYYTSILEKLTEDDSESYEQCIDAPSTVVEIRNRIMHPRKITGHSSIFKFSDEARIQAAFLSSWQLEMCLLNLFNYQGVYSNRLKLGRYEGDYGDLPWVSNT